MFADHRRIIESIIFRYCGGIPWRDLPRKAFGPWQMMWKRHRTPAADGTRATVLTQVTAQADSIKGIDCAVSVDSRTDRGHQRPETRLGRKTTPALSPA
ncbi:transposase [Streptomyces sp. NPDC005930]|uniref:transposase n=1 Tax=Streptomyces sp. NPDC005930 TaxID=3364736 RepID=UPI00368F107F